MVSQYPHFLFYVNAVEAIRDSYGNYTQPTNETFFYSMCREETNGKGRQIQVGGEQLVFSSLIQLPANSVTLKEGTKVLIYADVNKVTMRIEGIVLKFDKGQLHNRIWI